MLHGLLQCFAAGINELPVFLGSCRFGIVCLLQKVLDTDKLTFFQNSGISLLHIHFKLFAKAPPLYDVDRGEDDKFGTLGVLAGTFQNILCGMSLHLLSAHGRVGLPDAGEEQTKVLVNLGAGAHGGTRVARDDLLLDGDGGRQSLDEVTLGLAHAPQELAGVRGQRLHISALPLGIERVERQ